MSAHEAKHSERRDGGAVKREAIPTQTILILITAGVVLHFIQWVLLPFAIAGIIAYLCTPFINWACARARKPRALIATGVFAAILLIASLIGWVGLPPLIRQLTSLVTDLQGMIERLARGTIGTGKIILFGEPMDAAGLAQAAAAGVRNWIGQTGQAVTLGAIATAGTLGLFLTIVLLFYFLLSGPQIGRGLFWLIPYAKRAQAEAIWTELDPILQRYFKGVILVLVYAAVAAYIGLGVVLGIRHAVFLALLTGILEFIPVAGPAASALIAGLVALRNATGIGSIIGYALYAIALRLSIDQLLGPVVLGAAARLRPPLIIFCFLAGGVLFGAVGVILAVPAALAVKVTLAEARGEPLAADKSREPKTAIR
jgi:predicted PurR-regulated permease PerM